ncbi:hypothetical protein N658DRAFT_414129 [Parathielavia hyrcaniae]|uniref:Uncharacterized protein n=1 Tax=Parathielavia hyrcaniae TaxID=113614 RepID=A0AAN6T5I8_9PEZI|nr:hypothetical protein N658DRAFT_414129 [Parathielavia hyrcaniae]
MPKFPFGRRKSTADNLENVTVTGPSFRVLERTEVVGSKAFDSGGRHAAPTHSFHRTTGSDLTVEDNIFADLKSNRGSGSSNTTKTTLTDNSSRHSNASTAPSSADTGGSDEARSAQRKPPAEIPLPPVPKSSSGGFLKAAGRTFSFGGQKKQLPPPPTIHESPPSSPIAAEMQTPARVRPRATTSSTSTTVTPPKVEDDFDLDLGGDFGKMFSGNDKRASVVTVRGNQPYSGQMPAPRSLTTARPTQPTPIHIDKTTAVEPPAHSWSSQHSNDQLIGPSSPSLLPTVKPNPAPPVPRHSSPFPERQKPGTSPEAGLSRPSLATQRSNSAEDVEDEEARLLKDSISTVTRFIHGPGAPSSSSAGRYRRDESSPEGDSDSLFDSSPAYSSKYGSRYSARKPPTSTHGSNKVMTPAEFERYRQDKERQDRERRIIGAPGAKTGADEDEEDNYEDDEDDAEKARQQAKQRRKQEAHMSVYRQQMMKITGESAGSVTSSRPSLQMSFSTPNLPNGAVSSGGTDTAGDPEEDEETPLAYLAAAGFPNKNRPPNRLSTMGSNPNLRAAMQPSFQRPVSVVGDLAAAPNPRLPAFARNLPTDPFLGAGLVRNPVRESFALGGGSPGPGQPGAPVPPGGLIGVIANEERARAMRRGSPHLPDGPSVIPGAAGFDPVAGIPSHMMYQGAPSPAMLSPGDQAQIHMTQQMQQFMQMQMQFMQMMSGHNGNPPAMAGGGPLTSPSAGNLSAMGGLTPSSSGPEMRHSFVANGSMLDSPFGRGDSQMRTMSMVQPSSASWIQPTQPAAGFAPSIRMQGGLYAPSIAPSERSNVGLPGRYRPVSHVPPAPPATSHNLRKSPTMPGAIQISVTKVGNASDDDDEEGWEAMKAKRDKKKSMWRSKKSGAVGDDIGAMIS